MYENFTLLTIHKSHHWRFVRRWRTDTQPPVDSWKPLIGNSSPLARSLSRNRCGNLAFMTETACN